MNPMLNPNTDSPTSAVGAAVATVAFLLRNRRSSVGNVRHIRGRTVAYVGDAQS